MSRKPNIILIMTDTQATNMVGCYTGKSLNTQNIDGLAEEGYRFDSAFTCAPVCTPARAGLFTGIYANQSGPWTNNIALGRNISTMGRYFKDAGYNTCYIGKWHLDGHDYFGTGVCPEEWDADYWYDGANYLADLNDHQIKLWRNGLNTAQDVRDNDIDASFTWAHEISERAISYLDSYHVRSNPEQPFLMVLSYDEPHHPFTCPAEYIDKYEDFYYDLGPKAFDDLGKKPEHQQLWSEAMPAPVDEQGRYHHPLYFACNDFVDDQIGRVIKNLDQSELDNTWIVYTSDHGEMMGAHKLISKGSTGYDDITKIPLIVRPPKDVRKNVSSITTPVSHIDVLPTLMALADINKPDILPGDNLLNFIDTPDQERGVMVEFNRYEIEHDSFGGFIPMRVWVEKNYKLVINLFTSDELYHRIDDPDELTNLIGSPDFAEIRNQMHDRLLAYMEKIRDPFRTFEWSTRPWRTDKEPQWMGSFRPRPEDGYSPVIRDYDTGMPTDGVKVEDKKLKF
ncbi:sulfatase-like hydrolase/transferase [Vibrio mediterranei]|uniref:sulfatase-like hydrolase/transferase n=1 Tax=Vibrio mediterranei TaxID=689 RepID=UPI001EFE1E88|nr:sulfatase-like hydrolase/transferase [Vibrio mediterranei]MCG9627746.1 sulfatase-like hydrolase/transferase [Vibrio mediterranei]